MASAPLPSVAITALAIPVVAGIAWLAVGSAPMAWIAVNALALVLAVALAFWLPRSERGALILAAAVVLAIWATALTAIPVEGVRRWISIGPVRLHLGYLLLPLLAVLAWRLRSPAAAALLVAALGATVLQPDRAVTVGLTAAVAFLALQRRDGPSVLAFAAGLAACFTVSQQPDDLAPVRFVEQVQSDAWAMQPAAGLVLTLAALTPLLLLRHTSAAAAPLAAFLTAAGLMAFAGPYPSILIGYGAAPILGFGLALAALRCQNQVR